MGKHLCKMCDTLWEINGEDTIVKCPECGYTMTVTSPMTKKQLHMHNQATYYRKKHLFDKAMIIYDKLLAFNAKDAEAYWGKALCRFGVEYVVNVKENSVVPICHRTELISFSCDKDYRTALKYGNIETRAMYKQEAKIIDRMQKAMIKVTVKQEPYDIFLCCKDYDAKGNQTIDSRITEKLHKRLENEGYHVFSHIVSLNEDAQCFPEPYIYNALCTSSLMIVIGTKTEYINDCWVVNEWGRFLAMASAGEDKHIIPVYQNINPYEFPIEFSHMDMLTFEIKNFYRQLSSRVEECMNSVKQNEVVSMINRVLSRGISSTRIDRVFDMLRNEEFIAAQRECESILLTNPYEAKAYIGRLMADRNICNERELAQSTTPLQEFADFINALECADCAYKEVLLEYDKESQERMQREENQRMYQKALRLQQAESEREFREAIKLFLRLGNYRDSKKRLRELNKKYKVTMEKVV